MKKIISGVLSAALVLSMGITAFAQSAETKTGLDVTDNNTSTHTVDVTVEGAAATTVYSVDVAWDATDFTYTAPDSGTWDPATHTYGGTEGGSWNKNSAKATVTNHSNAKVGVAADIDNGTKNGVTASVSVGKATLETGDGLTPETADNTDVTINVSGTPNTSTGFTVGTVTITLSAAE